MSTNTVVQDLVIVFMAVPVQSVPISSHLPLYAGTRAKLQNLDDLSLSPHRVHSSFNSGSP